MKSMLISGISYPKKNDIFLPDRCTPIKDRDSDFCEDKDRGKIMKNTKSKGIKDIIYTILVWAMLAGSIIFAVTSIIKAAPVIIRQIQVKTNEKYQIYEEARKAEEADYETFKTREIVLETLSEEQSGSFASDFSAPTTTLPRIKADDYNKAAHLTEVVIKALPERIADAVIKNYTIEFIATPEKQDGGFYTAGRHDSGTRTITVVFDGTNFKQAAMVLTHEIGHMVFGQTLETFIDAGYIRNTDLTPINFHNDIDSYSLIYDEYMAQAFSEYIWYNENLKMSDERFYQTMDKAVESFSFDPFCFM